MGQGVEASLGHLWRQQLACWLQRRAISSFTLLPEAALPHRWRMCTAGAPAHRKPGGLTQHVEATALLAEALQHSTHHQAIHAAVRRADLQGDGGSSAVRAAKLRPAALPGRPRVATLCTLLEKCAQPSCSIRERYGSVGVTAGRAQQALHGQLPADANCGCTACGSCGNRHHSVAYGMPPWMCHQPVYNALTAHLISLIVSCRGSRWMAGSRG